MIRIILIKLRSEGIGGVMRTIWRRIFPTRLKCYSQYMTAFDNKRGIEIGGPSIKFGPRGLFPVYPIALQIDNCNFSSQTMWEGGIQEGETFIYCSEKNPGRQSILEATDLHPILSESYDFLLSSHTLEHTANPLLALEEWTRVIKTHGMLMLIVPHKDGTFDHNRHTTPFSHVLKDFQDNVSEHDMTHLEEILVKHDLTRDPGLRDAVELKKRCEDNFRNRGMHHHVFDTALLVEMVHHTKLQILAVEVRRPFDICILAQKPDTSFPTDNKIFREGIPNYCKHSPFYTDRERLV